jgi:hypothetical protein
VVSGLPPLSPPGRRRRHHQHRRASLPGKIAKVSVIADALPKEFQKAFAPAERQQLMWIEFDPDVTPPPYFTKVTIS